MPAKQHYKRMLVKASLTRSDSHHVTLSGFVTATFWAEKSEVSKTGLVQKTDFQKISTLFGVFSKTIYKTLESSFNLWYSSNYLTRQKAEKVAKSGIFTKH